jgi:hypothetical protein
MTTEVEGVEVKIDGGQSISLPHDPVPVATGMHLLDARSPLGSAVRLEVSVKLGESVPVNFQFSAAPTPAPLPAPSEPPKAPPNLTPEPTSARVAPDNRSRAAPVGGCGRGSVSSSPARRLRLRWRSLRAAVEASSRWASWDEPTP